MPPDVNDDEIEDGGALEDSETDLPPPGAPGPLFEAGGVVRSQPNAPSVFVTDKLSREATTSYLAYGLVILFATTILVHYVLMAGLIVVHYGVVLKAIPGNADDKSLEAMERIFNTVLPVISGLVGTAVAYYFGREKQQELDQKR